MMKDNNNLKTYRPLPWYKSVWNSFKEKIKDKRHNFKFPWKKLLIIFILGLIVLGIYVLVLINRVSVPLRNPYDKTGFVEAEQFIKTNGAETIIENESYQLIFNNENTTFVLKDLATGSEYRSNPSTTSTRFLDPLIVYYAGSLGADTPMGVYDNAIKQQDYLIRLTTNSIEVLYEIGGKKTVDRTDFPEIINDDRMQEKILSKLEKGSISYRRVTEQCYVIGELNGIKVWKLKDGIQTSMLNQLYKVFYEECGYTVEDLEYDLKLNGIVYEDKYAYIEIAIMYTISDKGLDISLINESIYEKEKFPLVYVDVLPYFASAGLTDHGYTLVPDGSGSLIDFNNNRSFAVRYQQRIYGHELAAIQNVMKTKTETLNLPLFGKKINDNGLIAIADEGAEMASIIAGVSSVDNPYNQAYFRYYLRESEPFKFASISSSSVIIKWTDWYATSDFKINIILVNDDQGSYSAMAKTYQNYLIDKGILSLKDKTNTVTLDLTLLGGYLVRENFIGFPYMTVKSLTNTDEVKHIVDDLIQDGITEINVIYKGWSNDGLKPSYMGEITYNKQTGKKKSLLALQDYFNNHDLNFFPEVMINTAYTKKDFNERNDAVRNVFGKVVKNYDYNEAIFYADNDTLPYYTLKPTTYEKTLSNISKKYNSLTFNNIAFSDFGNQSYGSYDKKDNLFRTDTINYFNNVMDDKHSSFNNIMFRNPNLYALKYANYVTDIPTYGTNYQIVGASVPFYQLVLSGYLDYSSYSFNIDDKYSFNWHKMKAIETGSNISMTWSYHTTIDLAKTEYSSYYSTYYKNWYDKLLETYQELNGVGIYHTTLDKHEILNTDGSITKTIYENGKEIVFNYSITSYNYNGFIISPNSYQVVKEAN